MRGRGPKRGGEGLGRFGRWSEYPPAVCPPDKTRACTGKPLVNHRCASIHFDRSSFLSRMAMTTIPKRLPRAGRLFVFFLRLSNNIYLFVCVAFHFWKASILLCRGNKMNEFHTVPACNEHSVNNSSPLYLISRLYEKDSCGEMSFFSLILVYLDRHICQDSWLLNKSLF